MTRYSRICTHASDFEEKVNFFRDKLQQRGYNEKDLAILRNKSETRVEPYERTKTTKKEIPLVFTLPYHPHIKHLALKRALQKHWNLINGNEFLNELFPTINPSLPINDREISRITQYDPEFRNLDCPNKKKINWIERMCES